MRYLSDPIETMRRRRSCRSYQEKPLDPDAASKLRGFLETLTEGPLGTKARFTLFAAEEGDASALKGLGAYGLIKHPQAFLAGASTQGPHALEDFGYLMERAVLEATSLGIDTCWLGGVFSKGRFAGRLSLREGEIMPAVVAAGYGVEGALDKDRVRRMAGASSRLPAASLFFEGAFGIPIPGDLHAAYAEALERTRWAPSASNRQPWRVAHAGAAWHFYLERTPGYGKGSLIFRLFRVADLQRLDIGIAMCHFEGALRAQGLDGAWSVGDPGVPAPDRKVEYVATWVPKP